MKFSEFAKDEKGGLEGKKAKIGDVFNKEITVTGYRIFPSKCKQAEECLQLQFTMDGETCVLFTNSDVLLRQAKKYAEYMPFETVIKNIGSYYTFS